MPEYTQKQERLRTVALNALTYISEHPCECGHQHGDCRSAADRGEIDRNDMCWPCYAKYKLSTAK